MIANSATPYPGDPHPFTLNDLRVQNTVPDVPSTTSTLTLAGVAVAAALAIGAFVWADPLHWFTPHEASQPTPAVAPSGVAARPTESQEITAPLTPVPPTKSVEAPIAPAPTARAPQAAAPVVQPRAASIKPESRRTPADKTNTKLAQASTNEKTAPPALTRPEEQATPPVLERTDAPIVPKVADDTKNTPKPAATNDQTPAAD
jgi:hypothetical protein